MCMQISRQGDSAAHVSSGTAHPGLHIALLHRHVEARADTGFCAQWGAFTSTSTDIQAAKGFTDRKTGVIFKISVLSGRNICPYSFFPTESEVLLSPNHRFVVTSEPYELDGYTMLDLLQQIDTTFYS